MPQATQSIESVRDFWQRNPLFSGESKFKPGTKEFFEDHSRVYYEDIFVNRTPEKFLPAHVELAKVLDLGCGVGFWTIEIQKLRTCKEFYSADLTQTALDITEKRLAAYGLKSNLSLQNAEKMTFADNFFNHVNCQGVIHHTPDTDAAIKEIARVLKPGGTACISVYYKNIFVRNWSRISLVGKLLSKLGAGLKGRGREGIFSISDPDEVIRLYDGTGNPIGKSYSRKQIIDMVSPYFEVQQVFKYFFPLRALPVKLPKLMHRFLSDNFGFMIHLNLRKK